MPTTVTVSDMACGGCETNVEEALLALAGVERADADQAAGVVVVEGDAADDAIRAAIEGAGYDASL